MKINEYSQEEIRFCLAQKAAEVEPSAELFNRIKKNIQELECENMMKSKIFCFKKSKLSIAVLTCCIFLLGSTAVIGATLAKSWIGHSSSRYVTFPETDKIINDVGFAPKYTETLPGGFKFDRGGTGESKLVDEAGNAVTQTKDVRFVYRRGTEKSPLTLTVSQIDEEFVDFSSNKLVGNHKGINLYYYEQKYKFVPVGYELTEEEKKAFEAGELEISYGASEVSCANVQALSWYEEGLLYTIMGNDYNFTIEDMIEMAKTVIEAE